MHLPVVLCIAIGLFVNREEQQASFCPSITEDTTRWTGYVFIIPLEKRKKKSDVSNIANWECIGTTRQVTQRCGPGERQASQLIVDEKDTYTILLQGKQERRLNSAVKIDTKRDGDFWYVERYVSVGNYRYEIFNEENITEKPASPSSQMPLSPKGG